MGRYDFRPLRVHQTASQLLATDRILTTPSWYNVVGSIPPAQTLVRTQPLRHQQRIRGSKTKKASKLFQPQSIVYEEDALRKEFYKDHPWELARPRVVLENDGRDAERDDWSHMSQSHRPVSGESVVQRQTRLMQVQPSISRAQAYDQARKEFYELRLQEDVERRVAKEEAEATGAYFGKSMLEIGMELEDKMFEEWKEWAAGEVLLMEQKQAAMYTGLDNESMAMSPDDPETAAAIEEVADSIPAKGQEAFGGAPFRP